ncbi:MAG: peptidoglycan-binding protein [Pseudomonadota bacterium]
MITRTLALGLILVGSIGVASADYNEAMRYYEQQDYSQALPQFREAAEQGDPDAQYMLGRLHESGRGTPQDFVQAHKWYNLAASRGHRHAAEARDALAERMTAGQIAQAQQAARRWQPDEAEAQETNPQSRPDIDSLSDQERLAETQRELNRLGYDAGPTDGVMGTRTRGAIQQYQADMGMYMTGRPSDDLLERLRQAEKNDVPAHSERQQPTRSRVALQDDFRDGNYRRDPAWTVISGEFDVDEYGLRTAVDTPRELSTDRPEELGLAVLGMILGQTDEGRQVGESASGRPARIFTQARIDNAFRMELELASLQQPGNLEMGVFQGNRPNGGGYRLVYSAGSQSGLSLVRLISGNAEIVARHEGRLDLEDNYFHNIVWTRDENGQMQVRVDDQRLLRVQDNGLRGDFRGFVLANHGGNYALRRVRIED